MTNKVIRKFVVSGLVIFAVVGMLVLLGKPTMPDAQSMDDGARFCASIGTNAKVPQIEALAKAFVGKPVLLEKEGGAITMARIGLCHCRIAISDTATIVTRMACNG